MPYEEQHKQQWREYEEKMQLWKATHPEMKHLEREDRDLRNLTAAGLLHLKRMKPPSYPTSAPRTGYHVFQQERLDQLQTDGISGNKATQQIAKEWREADEETKQK
mmetsp:Transcript_36977/g.95869  ORF Transcript_36977/g.95869 Transcript_36977/m.95869 type:complete len:106 (-) Transcript_36977:64-381(-)